VLLKLWQRDGGVNILGGLIHMFYVGGEEEQSGTENKITKITKPSKETPK